MPATRTLKKFVEAYQHDRQDRRRSAKRLCADHGEGEHARDEGAI